MRQKIVGNVDKKKALPEMFLQCPDFFCYDEL